MNTVFTMFPCGCVGILFDEPLPGMDNKNALIFRSCDGTDAYDIACFYRHMELKKVQGSRPLTKVEVLDILGKVVDAVGTANAASDFHLAFRTLANQFERKGLKPVVEKTDAPSHQPESS